MVSNVLAAAAVLRRRVRRVMILGLFGLLGAAGLTPLILYLPRVAWTKYLLLALACLYAGRKVVHVVKAQRAYKQLVLEEHFLRYGSSGRLVRQSMQHDEHVWANSRLIAGLKAAAKHRFPADGMKDDRRRLIDTRFRHAFRRLIPRTSVVDAGLVAAVVVTLAAAPTISFDARAVLFASGLLALGLVVAVEVGNAYASRRLASGLDRWFGTLSEWALEDVLPELEPIHGSYSHRLLYFAHPWFAGGSPSAEHFEETPSGLTLRAGDDGELPVPPVLGDDEES